MRNKLAVILIVSLALSQINFGAIVTRDDVYIQKQNEEFVLKDEAYNYFNSLRNWLERESKVELLRKVASHSELKGYYSENEIDWEHLYDDLDTKATRSIAYLTFTAIEPSNISYTLYGQVDKDIQISTNDVDWTVWDGSTIQLQANDTIKVKNNKNTLNTQSTKLKFNITGKVKASGNINSLINFSNLSEYCFTGLFENCIGLIEAPDMPSTNLSQSCYSSMFNGCSNLEGMPYLPASKLASYCYSFMFANCSKLERIRLGYTGNFSSSFNQWVGNITTTGTLYYNGTDTKKGSSGIPNNWVVIPFN